MSNKYELEQKVFQMIGGKQTLVGLFIAKVVRGHIRLGFSRCRPVDKFNLREAKVIAGRNLADAAEPFPNLKGFTKISHRAADFKEQYNDFKIRAKAYFKQNHLAPCHTPPDMTKHNAEMKRRDEDKIVVAIMKALRESMPASVNAKVGDGLLREFTVPFIKFGKILQAEGMPMLGGMVNLDSTEQPADTPENREAARNAVNLALGGNASETLKPSQKYIRDAFGRFATKPVAVEAED